MTFFTSFSVFGRLQNSASAHITVLRCVHLSRLFTIIFAVLSLSISSLRYIRRREKLSFRTSVNHRLASCFRLTAAIIGICLGIFGFFMICASLVAVFIVGCPTRIAL
uniref:Uncharacterized protein n=1 Tax=Sipha flava TaxID=143950 RepID=A0A2S2Q4M3_9HEMI